MRTIAIKDKIIREYLELNGHSPLMVIDGIYIFKKTPEIKQEIRTLKTK